MHCFLFDADYVGYTARNLQQCIVEHKNSANGKHFFEAHGDISFLKESQFRILRKCQTENSIASNSVYEMLFIKERCLKDPRKDFITVLFLL